MEYGFILILLLILTGLLVSFLCSMVGLGGGVLFIPILVIIYGIDSNLAVGTSIFCMCMVTLSASIGYARHRCVDWRLAIAYDIFDIPGIILGAWITTLIPSQYLEIICGIAICIIASLILFKKSKPHHSPEESCELPLELSENQLNHASEIELENLKKPAIAIDYSSAWKGKNIKFVILSSFLGGLVTGMVGLGGGTVDTTTMLLLGVPPQIAFGSSELAMLLTNGVGFTSHALLGNVLWTYAIPMGIAAFVGAQLGSKVSTKIEGNILKKILGTIALFTGLRMLFM